VPAVEDAVDLVLGGGYRNYLGGLDGDLVDDVTSTEDVAASSVQWHHHGVISGQTDGLQQADNGEALVVDLDFAI
jgi:hypothetical protein